ncbi:MAG: sensor histidine kinase [Terriglobales bacterium]
MRHDRKLFVLALLAGLPAVVVALALLWTGQHSTRLEWTLSLLIVACWLGFAEALRSRAVFPLQTLANLLAAVREGDFSLRARGARHEDPLGEVLFEVNTLGATLREQRLGAMEATALLERIMAEVDVAVFAFNPDRLLSLVNPTGERLLAARAEQVLGRPARELGLLTCLGGDPARTLQLTFPGGSGRWEMRRGSFREHGRTHQLLVLTDLSRALREEERQAWARLIRVLGHELNNSLAPIHSLAGTLARLLAADPAPPDWRGDMRHGLEIIASRAEALNRFLAAYTQWARMPQPRLGPARIGAVVCRAAELESRLAVRVHPGPEAVLEADPDQLEQALINLVKNAADAVLEAAPAGGAEVATGWRIQDGNAEIWVVDNGPGLASQANLFVPFFTTKPGGSGIGLLVSRQIAEAHGGALVLENRTDGPGCRARLLLPLRRAP